MGSRNKKHNPRGTGQQPATPLRHKLCGVGWDPPKATAGADFPTTLSWGNWLSMLCTGLLFPGYKNWMARPKVCQ